MSQLGVLTAGADCPGLNAVIRAVVGRAALSDCTTVGIMNGWAGLLSLDAHVVNETTVRDILPLGGTVLGAGRLNPVREGDDRLPEALAALDTLKIDGLIVIGDIDGLTVAHTMAKRGVRVVGVPGTMDNDVGGTDYCIGYDSAVSTVADAVDKLQTTASAHHRVMVVEAMGRGAGWVALAGALCGSAHMVLVPEIESSIDDVVRRLRARHDAGHDFTIVVVAEGAAVAGLPRPAEEQPRTTLAARMARPSVGEIIALEIEERTGYETRVTVLGHLQRGGSPTVYDRMMATRFGVAAVELALDGQWDRMVALKGNRTLAVPLAEARKGRPADPALYELATLFG
jgi:6-phosphofructokinase